VLKITSNPYQRGAAACALLAAILSIAGANVATLPVLGVGFVLALVAVSKRHQYPRKQ
jgi:hypothetical protein